ncbi:MAG: molybdopterin-binding protein [bacterium]
MTRGRIVSRSIISALAALQLFAAPISAQSVRAAGTSPSGLVLRDLDGKDHTVSAGEYARLSRHDTTVSAHRVEGKYSGVLLSELLALVHAPTGDSLRGKALTFYVKVVGADGYEVIFALADFDPGFTDRIAILADQKDGAPLPASEGPFHLIVPSEKRPARWVRQVVRIELRRAS